MGVVLFLKKTKEKTRAVLILNKYAYNSSLHAQTHGYLEVAVLLSHKL